MQTLGQAAERALQTVSQQPCAKSQDREIGAPETAEECRELREWALSQPAKLPPIPIERLTTHLEFISATLPSRFQDQESGRRRVAVFARILGTYSEPAIAHMALMACKTLKWFPTPAECLELLEGFVDPLTPRDQALRLCDSFTARTFDAFIERLKHRKISDDDLSVYSERWQAIAMERGFLRFVREGIEDPGKFVVRKPYQPDPTSAASRPRANCGDFEELN